MIENKIKNIEFESTYNDSVVFTNHSLDRLKERGINKSAVLALLNIKLPNINFYCFNSKM